MKEARKLHGYSQLKLAEICKVSTSYIREIEISRKFPSATTLQKIADALHLRPYQLFLDKRDGIEYDRIKLLEKLHKELEGKLTKNLRDVITGYLK